MFIGNLRVGVGVCEYVKLNDLQLNHCNSLQIPRHLTFHCEENNKFGETTYKSGCFVYLLAVKVFIYNFSSCLYMFVT